MINKSIKAAVLFALLSVLGPGTAFAYTQDSGTITDVYVNSNGSWALKLSGGFPNSDSQCASNGGWAGVNVGTSKELLTAVLLAKASGRTVVVSIYGCAGGGTTGWLNLGDIYVK